MFSKALFKQSCKANYIMWTTITIAVCVMLAVLMMISGSGDLSEMRVGITNTIVQDSIENESEKRAVNYYDIVESNIGEPVNYQGESSLFSYGMLFENADSIATNRGYEKGTEEYYEIFSLLFSNFPKDDLKALAGISGGLITEETIDQMVIDTGLGYNFLNYAEVNPNMKKEDYIREYCSSFLAINMTSDRGIEKALSGLKEYDFGLDDYSNLTYTNDAGEEVPKFVGESGKIYLKDLSNDSILTYQARLDYSTANVKDEQEIKAIKQSLIAEVGQSFLASMPKSVSESLQELGTMDLFNLITGSIFYKVAGLLLPIIYIIMVANNLIAGQVDSGSMAYVLSTSTKRKQVVYTQATFLVGSLFLMCLCTTAVSFICFTIIDRSMISMTYGQLALLNVGFFVTLFALSGISFLTSCIFNRTKHSMGIGGGLNMFFLVATILGLFGSKVLPNVVRIDSLNFFNYCSLITLFDEMSILSATTTFIPKLCVLIVVGIVCYVIGAERFKKKDLPL